MKYIQSATNPQVKQWKKLLTKKERDKTKTFIIEGFHLVEEALKSNIEIETIILSEGIDLPPSLDYGDVPVVEVSKDIAQSLADTETTQGVFAVCHQPSAISQEGNTYLLIDSAQDPGNLGTMIRTADAAGIDAVIVGKGSVDIYNPKVLRSAQGSHFHLPVVSSDLHEWMDNLSTRSIPVYGTALEDATVYNELTTTGAQQFALLVGNEGSGVNPDLLAKTTQNLYIPILGKSESLNVAVATGILLYYLKTLK